MNIDKQLDIIYDRFHLLFIGGRFDIADEDILRLLANPKELENSTILIGYLTVTLCARSKLQHRAKLVEFAERKFADREDKEQLLQGLR